MTEDDLVRVVRSGINIVGEFRACLLSLLSQPNCIIPMIVLLVGGGQSTTDSFSPDESLMPIGVTCHLQTCLQAIPITHPEGNH